MEDEAELAAIEESYRKGSLSTGDLKKKCIALLTEIVVSLQEKRAAITQATFDAFFNPVEKRRV